jgi:hypothetical protein
VHDKAGFDGFSQANFICQKNPGSKAAGGFGCDGELVRNKVDAGAREPSCRGAAKSPILLEGLRSKFIGPEIITLPGKETLFRFDKAQGIKQVLLPDFLLSRKVNKEPVPVLNG